MEVAHQSAVCGGEARGIHHEPKAAEDCRTPRRFATSSAARNSEGFGVRQSSAAFYSVFLVTLGLHTAFAQLPTARLLTIFPPGARVGSTSEVVVAGTDLDEASAVVFSHVDITARAKTNETTGLSEPNTFIVAVGSNVPPASYEVRIVGRFGISNPRRFAIGALPQIQETGNNSSANATEISLPVTINGRADSQAIDYFKFNAKKDERILAICEAAALDSRMEPSMMLLDGQGVEVERSRRGGLLDFRVPSDGQYVLKLHDFVYAGGSEYFYRLSVGALPYIDFVLPAIGNGGATNKFTMFGRNLPGSTASKFTAADGKKLERLEADIPIPAHGSSVPLGPNSAAFDVFECQLTASNAVSNSRLIGLAASPHIVRESTDAVQKVTVPCEVSGQFFPAGDIDTYSFEAKKGEVFWIEVVSQRLGLPTDPFIFVQRVTRDKDGKEQISDVQEISDSDANIGGPDFKTSSLDPAGKFEAKEDGEYRVRVRDLFNRANSNPAHVYWLGIRKEEPDFSLVALAQPPLSTAKDVKTAVVWPALARRGETMAIKVLAFRQRGFNGDIALSVSGLPPGVSSAGARIVSGQNSAMLLLTAADTVSTWAGSIDIMGKATINGKERAKEAHGGVLTWNVGDISKELVRPRLTADFTLGVCGDELAPVVIETAEAKAYEAPVGGKVQIPLKITRRGDFSEAFKVKAYGVSALESLKEMEVPNKTNVMTLEVDLNQQKLAAGDYQFYLLGPTKGKYASNADHAKQLEELAKAAETNATAFAAAAKKAGEELEAAKKAGGEIASAESALKEAKSKADAAEARKTALAARAKEATERTKAKEVTINIYSAPIFLKVTAPQTASASK
jgi:hypothetical protein